MILICQILITILVSNGDNSGSEEQVLVKVKGKIIREYDYIYLMDFTQGIKAYPEAKKLDYSRVTAYKTTCEKEKNKGENSGSNR